MSRWKTVAGCLAALVALGVVGLYRSAAEDKPAEKPGAAELAVRATAEAFVKAFNSGDAKAVAALWTADGEFVEANGEVLRGRKAIEESYVAFFKEHPKAKAEVNVTAVRLLGRHTATEEGTMTVTVPGRPAPSVSRYTALHVKDDDGWRMASVREYLPPAHELVSLKDVEWLVGDWAAKSGETELKLSYAWDEGKTFLNGRYTLTRGGKPVMSGTQKVGKGTAGQLRSWQFDKTGEASEWAWWPDAGKWLVDSADELPGGGQQTAVHLLTPLGKDAFLWQTLERWIDDVELPALPPLKVERVKASK